MPVAGGSEGFAAAQHTAFEGPLRGEWRIRRVAEFRCLPAAARTLGDMAFELKDALPQQVLSQLS
jgi:hypothetical protein